MSRIGFKREEDRPLRYIDAEGEERVVGRSQGSMSMRSRQLAELRERHPDAPESLLRESRSFSARETPLPGDIGSGLTNRPVRQIGEEPPADVQQVGDPRAVPVEVEQTGQDYDDPVAAVNKIILEDKDPLLHGSPNPSLMDEFGVGQLFDDNLWIEESFAFVFTTHGKIFVGGAEVTNPALGNDDLAEAENFYLTIVIPTGSVEGATVSASTGTAPTGTYNTEYWQIRRDSIWVQNSDIHITRFA